MQRLCPATPEDIEAVAEIHRKLIEGAVWLPAQDRIATDFVKSIEGERVFLYTDEDGKVLGFIPVWEQGSFIHHLYVSSENQRCGVGTGLIDSLRVWLPKPWHLKCVAANTEAMRFYNARGFQEVSIHNDANPPYVLLRNSEA